MNVHPVDRVVAQPDWIGVYLEEDIGPGDITTTSVIDAGVQGTARIVAKDPCVLAGGDAAAQVFARLGGSLHAWFPDGCRVEAGTVTHEVTGPAHAILSGERLALNILARMSGIATATRDLMELLALDCSPAVVAGTRKTTPGFRAFEKEAIRIGGGDPHRMGLFDEAMVKDNHIAAARSVGDAVRRAKAANPGLRVSCEAESLQAAREAAAAGADWVLIDNQTPQVGKAWAAELWKEFPGLKVEASGGITPANVVQYGWADRVSLGWLTQKAQGKDFGLDWDAPDGERPIHQKPGGKPET